MSQKKETEEAMIRSDKQKCIKCYKCITICPFNVLEEKEDGYPGLVEGKMCLECMHCGAACPVEAILYGDDKSIKDETIKELSPNFSKDLKSHILQRRSYRHFKQEPVDKKIIEDVLDTVRWTPSAKNQQPTKWIVISDKNLMKKMMDIIIDFVEKSGMSSEVASEFEEGNNVVMGEAPTLIIAYASDSAINAPADTHISVATAELLLQSKGVGTCWCGYLTRFLNNIEELKELLPEIPKGSSFHASLMAGYPQNEKYIHIPKRLKDADIKWVK